MFLSVCLFGLVGALWWFDNSLDENLRERRKREACTLAVHSALGGKDAYLVGLVMDSALPYRVAFAGGVWGFADPYALIAFLEVHDCVECVDVRECVREYGGASVMHPCFG